VIENITDLFSFEYSKESSMLEKHVQFIKYMHELSFLAVQNKIAVVVTNVVRNMDGREVENLNNSISMFVHKKIKLQKDGKKYQAQVLPSFGGKKEILYTITQSGIEAP
jgi:DNA repair protein RAD51